MCEPLASVSEFTKNLAEPIARMANLEDGCTGHFWEGRTLQVPALAGRGCPSLSYDLHCVDLNLGCAAMAQDLEDNNFTSIQQRISDTARKLGSSGDQHGPVAGVLGKCSLSICIAQYLNLVDWNGRQMHLNRREGSIQNDREFLTALA